MRKRIEIRRGDEYCTKVSSIYDKEDFFYEAYCKAAQGVQDIVCATKKYRSERRECLAQKPATSQDSAGITEYMQMAGYPNNFLAFCAGRGQGKTSAMVSFSTALRQLEESKTQDFWTDEIRGSSFYVLDPIDPTMMDKEDSILRVIISRMFKSYIEAQNDLCIRRSGYIEKEPELLKCFRQCYRNLDVLQKGRQLQDCYDDLEYLADLGDSANMKWTFHTLVTRFLELMFHVCGDGLQFLVIQIDDADLNSSNAYQIVEEMRKYCVVPNVIILMASDFEQLELTVEQYFLGEFETLRKTKSGHGEEIPSHCHKMMERYLDKLIPGARQVHLPQIDNYIRDHENELILKYVDDDQASKGPNNESPSKTEDNYQDALLGLIYKKTRLLLIKPKGYLHNLLPKTMRELTHLLVFLHDLPDIPVKGGTLSQAIEAVIESWTKSTNEADGETRRQRTAILTALALRRDNINAFVDYLRHCWVKAALNERQQAVVVPAMDVTTDLMVKQLLVRLEKYGAEKHSAWGPVKKCDDPQYTDVVETLNKLKALLTSQEDFGIIYISATILTLHMHLLAIQDLEDLGKDPEKGLERSPEESLNKDPEEGLRFKRLAQFVGRSVFPLEVGRFEYEGSSYEQMDIIYDLVSAAAPASATIDQAGLNTRNVADLLLSPGGPDISTSKAIPGIPYLPDQPGRLASFLQMFQNCLIRTAGRLDSSATTEMLDIVLSWDLQYHISKKLRKKNKELLEKNNIPETIKDWLPFEFWVQEQLSVMDEVYKDALDALEITTNKANLNTVVMRERDYIAALAMGNPHYASGWLNAVKKTLGDTLGRAYQELNNAVNTCKREKGKDQNTDRDLATTMLRSVRNISDLDIIEFKGHLLSFPALYKDGITPKSIIDKATNEAQDLLTADDETKLTDEELGYRLLDKVSEVTKLLSTVKQCQGKLKDIELAYFAPVSTRKPAAAPKPKDKQASKPSKKPAKR